MKNLEVWTEDNSGEVTIALDDKSLKLSTADAKRLCDVLNVMFKTKESRPRPAVRGWIP